MEQDLRQGCVLAPLLFNVFFAAVINVASTRFKADKERHHGRFGIPEEEKWGGGGRGKQLLESQSSRRRFRTCFMLTCWCRLAITRAAEEDDGGDRGRVRGVWPHRIGGQD